MIKKLFFLAFTLMLCTTSKAAEADYQVVPLPQSITLSSGAAYVIDDSKSIICDENADMKRNAGFLAEYIKDATHNELSVKTGGKKLAKGNIWLTLDKKIKNPEGYRITINNKGVVIAGKSPAGVFYAIQTLRKSLPLLQEKSAVNLPAATITDEPRFAYRGMMLDCGRHFFSVDFVKEYIDLLALHNMNRFHWHLSEDQGWRIEIKKYPKLTEVGAWRTSTVIGHNSDVEDGQPYGGFYTQEQIKEIVKYAADRYITVIPEIDMPGHMLSALTAYPELGCTGGPYQVGHYWGVYKDILCAGNDKVYQFVKDVLDEVCNLFPSEYIHIGGDEAPRVRWEQCPKCQAKIQQLGLKDNGKQSKEAQLQGYFAMEVQKYLASKGRKIIGWDELLGCNVDTSATIMSWRGAEPGAEAAKLGHDVIMSPNSYAYFDYYQTDKQWSEPMLIGGNLPIEKTYGYEPFAKGISQEAASHILGVQANLWTEYIGNERLAEYQVLPRMGALAEVQWMQPDKKDYKDFVKRMTKFRQYYDHKGYAYAKHIWPDLYLKKSKEM